jgi:hypothetical protein
MSSDHDAVTKADLQGAVREINTRIESAVETMRDIETHLLAEFHRYAKGTAHRLHTQEVSDSDMKERLHQIEERLLELERRIRPH